MLVRLRHMLWMTSFQAFEDSTLRHKPKLKEALHILDIIFVIIFGVEMLLKWMAVGFREYFRDPWNWLDFFIVIIGVIGLGICFLMIDNVPRSCSGSQ